MSKNIKIASTNFIQTWLRCEHRCQPRFDSIGGNDRLLRGRGRHGHRQRRRDQSHRNKSAGHLWLQFRTTRLEGLTTYLKLRADAFLKYTRHKCKLCCRLLWLKDLNCVCLFFRFSLLWDRPASRCRFDNVQHWHGCRNSAQNLEGKSFDLNKW